jgi:hypothetical protein
VLGLQSNTGSPKYDTEIPLLDLLISLIGQTIVTRYFTIQISGCFAGLLGLPFLLTPKAFITIVHLDIRANSYQRSKGHYCLRSATCDSSTKEGSLWQGLLRDCIL